MTNNRAPDHWVRLYGAVEQFEKRYGWRPSLHRIDWMTDEELRAVEEQLELVVKIIRLSPAVMPVLCGVLC